MSKAHPLINEVRDGQLFCVRCEVWKVLGDFAKAPRMKRGYHSWCKSCMSDYNKEKNAHQTEEQRQRRRLRRQTYQAAWARQWREANPEKDAAYQLRYKWGLTPEQFEAMLLAQRGQCLNPMCNRPATDLDHDHSCCPGMRSCGRCIRGILCHRCNTRLGWVEKDLDLVRGLIAYRDEAVERLKDTTIR